MGGRPSATPGRATLLALAVMASACDRAVPSPPPAASAVPAVASSTPQTPEPSRAPAPSAGPATATPPPAVPRVKVANIGIHIGGGPNDDETKAPIARSVASHFDELRACWTQVGDPQKGGDFGVDLLVPSQGGRAQVSNARTALGPDAFRACVVQVFEGVDFAKPRTGRTMASYALRFAP